MGTAAVAATVLCEEGYNWGGDTARVMIRSGKGSLLKRAVTGASEWQEGDR
jgi:hypothetical protein